MSYFHITSSATLYCSTLSHWNVLNTAESNLPWTAGAAAPCLGCRMKTACMHMLKYFMYCWACFAHALYPHASACACGLQGEELEACIRERERAVRQWGVGRDFADSLGRANANLAGKLLAVEGVLATKLDRVGGCVAPLPLVAVVVVAAAAAAVVVVAVEVVCLSLLPLLLRPLLLRTPLQQQAVASLLETNSDTSCWWTPSTLQQCMVVARVWIPEETNNK